jgi:hypothetical protein
MNPGGYLRWKHRCPRRVSIQNDQSIVKLIFVSNYKEQLNEKQFKGTSCIKWYNID